MFSILVAGCFLIQAQDPDSSYARFSGRVFDLETGTDVRGLVNFLRLSNKVPDDDISVLCKRNGWYEAGVTKPGRYRVVAVAPGYRPCIQEFHVSKVPAWHPLDLGLEKGTSISIRIRDQKGNGIDGAWGSLTYMGHNRKHALEWAYLQVHVGADTIRSRNGCLSWEGLPPGKWQIRLEKPGYLAKILETSGGRMSTILERGRLVYLSIQNRDGTPAPDILVSIYSLGKPVYSGISGAYGDMAATLVSGKNNLFLYRLPDGHEKMETTLTVPKKGRVNRITIRWGHP